MTDAAFSIRIERHAALGSTNDRAREAAEAGAAEGLLVQADRQAAGRGRRGRAWTSEPGNLYTSLLLRPNVAPAQAATLSFLAAVAVAETARAALGPSAQITCKWPNDVLVGGAKISGILLESRTASSSLVDWVIMGVGVNVAHHPPVTDYPVTDLNAEGARATPEAVLDVLAQRYGHWYEIWRREGFSPVRAAWLAMADGLGRPIRVRLPDSETAGVFHSLDQGGALILGLPDGGQRTISAGDVFRMN